MRRFFFEVFVIVVIVTAFGALLVGLSYVAIGLSLMPAKRFASLREGTASPVATPRRRS